MRLLILGLLVLLWSGCRSQVQVHRANTEPPSHQLWTELLKKHVSDDGNVNYQGFIQDKAKLKRYLDTLSQNPPDTNTWSNAEQLAYWVNAYNAFTVKLIVDNYPLESITELHPWPYIPGVRTVWHRKFFRIGGRKTSLDEIEHQILRKQFNEPRIHFAINCASKSCPPLRAEAYEADELEKQLTEQARSFINNPKYNQIEAERAEVSKIFSWFSGDFTKQGSLREYLSKYSNNVQLKADADIKYKAYDWDLNE